MPVGSQAQQTSSATGQPIGFDESQKTLHLWVTFKLTGSYPTGGDPFDITQFFTATAGGPGASIPTGALPLKVEFTSQKPTAQTNLYVYNYLPGTTLANGTIQVYTGAAAQTGLTELSAGAYAAGILADVIQAEIVFPKL